MTDDEINQQAESLLEQIWPIIEGAQAAAAFVAGANIAKQALLMFADEDRAALRDWLHDRLA
jgi:hypothetical protein